MSARPGVLVDVRRPADGGVSPNAYVPIISAEVRCFWPPRATEEEVAEVLREVFVETIRAVRSKRANG